ncbi:MULTISPECIES: YbaK/EbsC family protein [unclassified Curtobacterium]|uniref:aminoacyl-tRNA deacylase n=1 Tax=unclassified Curtobacterium TaxID=257496 RepID=UPI000F463398|nr:MULTISPECIES: YbaK/EbsC family protein [unclassified Curtobacterium]ROS46231.1 Cys-tRNA(Pro) deacylase [Curtobacterium sp. PhB78]TCL81265.1 Cys-tRNA(Pro) deacylase [Curtobacterium sp. PhB128]TCL85113.1 Cys-tRNA(Pro) deacylase [Curtobacterium sp. PhB142]TCL99390.1 Cys-tRNA(Pro) deacylase [Curtobacterium sp. PhB138]TCM01956.1 Cys-tRNA(Pro) deacylase [Curtobacterium sp. PhB134]
MTIDASTRFDTDAAARGLTVEVVERPAADSLQQAAELLGIDPGDIVKTLVVKRHDGGFLLALVPGGRSIAWKKLRTVVGVNKLSMPDAATALQASGYERGTITPIGATGDLPVYADERIVGRRVALGAGRHGASAFVDADDLVAAYGATVADITDEEPQRA